MEIKSAETNLFKRDRKRMDKRGYNLDELKAVVAILDLFDNQFAANFRQIFRPAASKFLAILSVLLRHFSLRHEKLDTNIYSLLVIEQVY
ncbi:hypothetical protein FACS1894139_00910 [Planctomycetales bacterium]|nr:hypothetical protein FACS1894107_06550 [Planctomycetales bacterium]GHT01542.1 hypothetical protein FACS1894108_15360 [Planctomycetales bacterium]GHT02549.1 hypothetical protein FACS1894139_00910 [Planctomycetales bacterium]